MVVGVWSFAHQLSGETQQNFPKKIQLRLFLRRASSPILNMLCGPLQQYFLTSKSRSYYTFSQPPTHKTETVTAKGRRDITIIILIIIATHLDQSNYLRQSTACVIIGFCSSLCASSCQSRHPRDKILS
jgi:hypothetical protein